MENYEIELELGFAVLEHLQLPVSEANCRRALKAVDIAQYRINPTDIFIYDEGAIAEVQSDSRDVKWSVTVDWEFKTCQCQCEDKTRHEDMAKRFGDPEGKHFCKHAMALLLRCESDLKNRLEPKAQTSEAIVVVYPNSNREVTYNV